MNTSPVRFQFFGGPLDGVLITYEHGKDIEQELYWLDGRNPQPHRYRLEDRGYVSQNLYEEEEN